MRTLLAVAVLMGVTTAGPAVADQSEPGVYGRVVDVDGRPVRGARVSVVRLPEYGTLGMGRLWCAFDPAPWCSYYSVTRVTDAKGRYAIPLDPDSEIGQRGERFVSVVRPHRTAGLPASVTLTLEYEQRPVTLPDLRFWAGRASVAPETPRARLVSVVPPGPEYGVPAPVANPGILEKSPTDLPKVELSQGRDAVFTHDPVPYARPADPRTVELGTTGGSGVVTMLLDRYLVTYRGLPQPVSGGVRPLSRGARCFVYDFWQRLVALRGCRLTDGRLGSGVDAAYLGATDWWGTSSRLLVDLRRVRTMDAVVVRGCDDVEIETSSDGRTFRPFERKATSTDSGLLVSDPVAARYVRVAPDSFCDKPVTEISVFAPL